MRAGLQDSGECEPYELTPVSLGMRVDIANTGEVLEYLDALDAQDAAGSRGPHAG